MSEPAVKSGAMLEIDESDYLYGVGRLTLRVASTGPAQRWPDDAWVPVTGTQLSRDGTEIGSRRVLVRARALQRGAAA